MDHNQQIQRSEASDIPLTLAFSAIDRDMLPIVGGKGANLGELMRAGFPVPDGFCVTTTAYDLACQQADLAPLLEALAAVRADDSARLEHDAAAARDALLAVPIPESVIAAIRAAHDTLMREESLPVAVRSSATAEDLPYASFAGQQESFLNVVGIDALLDAVQRCWASLWSDRAVIYRARRGIDPRTVRLAVVVQRMIDAGVAGVLFTADPVSGRRAQTVIDANPGLGEAVVSGSVNPDHFVVDTAIHEIVERRLGEKRLRIRALPDGGTERVALANQETTPCLTTEQITALVELGQRVERHYGLPQDIEWAIDASSQVWLTQARPITTLYPLPEGSSGHGGPLRLYISVNVSQGVFRPLTPMGLAALRLVVSSIATFLGAPPTDPRIGPAFIVEAGQRLFIDETYMFRSRLWRPAVLRILPASEARAGAIVQHLAADPRFALTAPSRFKEVLRLFMALARSSAWFHLIQVLFLTGQALLAPRSIRRHHLRAQQRLRAAGERLNTLHASAEERLAMFEHLLLEQLPPLLPSILPLLGLSLGLPIIAKRFSDGLASEDEREVTLRGLPYNPTTEMDLALWELARRLRTDTKVVSLLREKLPEQLASAYRAGTLPPVFQQGLADFLKLYGHRGVSEIDLGLPRWSEDPTYIIGVLNNYQRLTTSEAAPDAHFHQSREAAETMVNELKQRARRSSWLRGKLVGFSLNRIRALLGLREAPKFDLVLLLSSGRRLLLSIGEELVRAGRLESSADLFYLNLMEVHEAVAGKDMRAAAREHRANYEREMQRQHIPRVLLSDGTEPEALVHEAGGDTSDIILAGTAASAGVVKGAARVILQPVGARLEPGEILVAPSTDPGWTPLFLTARGLVMETGGPMSHGAVIAREYGIPAIVGVAGATERIRTGQQITLDGSAGTVRLV